jgi:acetyl-CoA carboxylase biotin carboxyl carrier protein
MMSDERAPAGADDDPVLAALAALLPDLERSGVVELEVALPDARLFMRRRPGPAPAHALAAELAEAEAEDSGLLSIMTPLSGVYYASPAPDEPAYVQEGDLVEAGQVVGLVEAMKVFNEIHAEADGTIARILVAGGQLVQAGQPLMRLRPAAAALEGEPV